MSAGGASLAGSSRSLRLDPFALPVRFRRAMPGRTSGASGRAAPRARGAAPRGGAASTWRVNAAGHDVPRRRDPAGAARGRRTAPSPSCSSIAIPRCRCRSTPRPTATTSWPSGSCGARARLPLLVADARWHAARAVCAHRRVPRCATGATPAAPQRRQGAPAVDPDAAQARAARRQRDGVHRGEREIIARS